jgi:hypothetical protein
MLLLLLQTVVAPATIVPDVVTPPPPAPVACVGAWTEPTGPCNAPCEAAGFRMSTFVITVPAANGGAPCPVADGTPREVPCTSDVACPKPPVHCVGAWLETGTCNAKCESAGTKTSTYTVTTPASNGGAPCEAASGATREVPCSNPEPCARPQLALEPVPTPPPVVPPPPEPVPTPPPVVPTPPPPVVTPEPVPQAAAVVPVAVQPAAAAAAAEPAAAAPAPAVTVLQP